MIHYHGSPLGGRTKDAAIFFSGRHGLVSHARPDQMAIVAECCQSFVLDNGAFSQWKRGKEMDVPEYLSWVREWHRHPGFDWALIPDVIDGDEQTNDAHIHTWQNEFGTRHGVPIWHLHESFLRLERLAESWPTVALGSSGVWSRPGSHSWWSRMREVMKVICDDQGRPVVKVHGLRMLDPRIFSRLPLSSADSTNAALNQGSLNRFGMYKPPDSGTRAIVIASRIEAQNSSPVWCDRSEDDEKM